MNRDEEVFAGALAIPAARRAAYLESACGGDRELRARVEDLLQNASEADGFLEVPLALRPPDTPVEKPGELIGRYKLLEQIGEGGCGVVYLAEQQHPVSRRVALKVIKLGMDTKAVVARFEAERQALALMVHPNIALALDAGATETGRPFFVMELVGGIPITRYCDENQLSTAARLRLFVQVCSAIQHAHQKGIIHRDIKPSNILVARLDGVAVPKVIDFGVAKATLGRLTDATVFTAFEQFVGTPAYMSPEQTQLGGLDVDTRSDIYSLGVLLYELLTGRPPLDPKTLWQSGLDEIRRVIREVDPLRPSTRFDTFTDADRAAIARRRGTVPAQLSALVRGDLDWIVMKALEKERSRRYETANGLARDIERHLNHEPVVARPPSLSYRCEKLLLRHRLAVFASAAVAASLVIGLAFSTVLFLREKAARQRAVAAETAQGVLRRQAEAGRQRAAEEAARSAQVAQSLREVLESVGPRVALGRTSVRDILGQTQQNLDAELQGQPAVLSELRDTLGTVYRDLGEYTRAAALHRAALDERRARLGENHADVATSLDNLGVALRMHWDLVAAEAVLREALAIRRGLFGAEHPAVASTLYHLADVLDMSMRLPEALSLRQEVLALRRRLFGAEHPEVAESIYGVASATRALLRFPEAERLFREALAMQRRLLGPEHPDVALTLHSLALCLDQQGRRTEAIHVARESLAMRRKLLGEDHHQVGLSLARLANILTTDGELDEAERCLRQAIVFLRRDGDNIDTANALAALARHLNRTSNADDEAESLARESAAMLLRLAEKGTPPTRDPLLPLREILRKQGRVEIAETLKSKVPVRLEDPVPRK